jgi:superfamily II RNA helicase
MCKNEIAKTLVSEREYLDKLKIDIDVADRALKDIPVDVCNRYLYLKNYIPTVSNKKRREAEREVYQILSKNNNCMLESIQVQKRNMLICELESGESYVAHLETYIPRNVKTICDILVERNFIEFNENVYRFTNKGQIAAGIAEMHPLVAADCFQSWSELTPKQLVGLLSCFTDVKIDQDNKASVPITTDAVLKRHTNEVVGAFRLYEDLENARKTDPAYDYTNPVIFDMTDLMVEWCEFTDDIQCKLFIQDKLLCSVGDFTKAILKISAIVKEFTAVCEHMGMVDFQHKLSQIDGMILKYVATSQSLYL